MTINSKHVLYGTGKQNDECMTPRYAVEPLLEFIPKGITIWCPFDTPDSEYVKVFTEHNINVVASHKDTGGDFMVSEPNNWDIIISNPPFHGKKQIVERALSFEKPFCLLLPLTWLNDSAPKQVFCDKDLELLMFDKRIKFGNQPDVGITFSSAYYCYKFLPKQIIMRRLNIPSKKISKKS